ncbi:MAG TPA: type II secretion system protein GspL [Sphingopyxis sp.]|nr:type II secretion system protein GspL [Sphingopyxis sp.]
MTERLILCLPTKAALADASRNSAAALADASRNGTAALADASRESVAALADAREEGTAELAAGRDQRPVPAPYWAWLSADRIIASGTGDGWRTRAEAGFHGSQDGPIVIALAPASDAPIRFMIYDDAPPPQAAAAAQLDALNHVLGDRAEAHIVAATPTAAGQGFPVATTRHHAMQLWQHWLLAQNLVAEAIVPAALLLPGPEGGGLVSAQLGGQRIIRSHAHGYASDPMIDQMIADGANIRLIDAAEWEVALVGVTQHIPLNLLHGQWKVKQDWSLDAEMMRWMKRLALALVLISLLVIAVQMLRLKADASRADQAVMAAAQTLGIRAENAADAEAEMDRRMIEKGGGPLAFSVPASALYAALADAPAVALKSLSHRGDGTLSASIAAPRVDDLNPVLLALQARGYRITAQPMAGTDGQQIANITIRAMP